ncbi:hypothetical protein [Acidithiobacillus ferrivorans]|uniref:Uncharacterized protein n=1 Tax=Acidithiobacillus ferrivorans TaxID=160808 RepID=A0A7T4WD34_9PROT|nr:hypothetical protein [Acidithiobacillus ferrivorans]QQD72317.1 hypothetical protein H2515_13065 [Acidithiobacillus ferrivorans]
MSMKTECGQSVDSNWGNVPCPAVFMGMGDADLAEMHMWLSRNTPARALSTPSASYQEGVYFCLGQVGIGFTAITDAAIIKTWRDRHGSEWTWNDETMEADCDAMRLVGQGVDSSDLSKDEFAAFAQGMLDAATACGWVGPC